VRLRQGRRCPGSEPAGDFQDAQGAGGNPHLQPGRRPTWRYVAGIVGGLFYLLPSLFGATLVSLFAAFPKELIAALAGVMAEADEREAGLTFLVSVSGMSFLALSVALWGG